jgi:hypothetical protein
MSGSVIMIRVTPTDYDRWIAEHDGAKDHRLEYGLTDGPVYRDMSEPDTVLIQLETDDIDRARGWFADPRFKEGAMRAGKVQREIIFGTHK